MSKYPLSFRQDVAALAALAPAGLVARVAGVSASSVRRWVEQLPVQVPDVAPPTVGPGVDIDRLAELRSLYRAAQVALEGTPVHQQASLLRESRFLLAEIDEIAESALPVAVAPATPIEVARQRREERLKGG